MNTREDRKETLFQASARQLDKNRELALVSYVESVKATTKSDQEFWQKASNNRFGYDQADIKRALDYMPEREKPVQSTGRTSEKRRLTNQYTRENVQKVHDITPKPLPAKTPPQRRRVSAWDDILEKSRPKVKVDNIKSERAKAAFSGKALDESSIRYRSVVVQVPVQALVDAKVKTVPLSRGEAYLRGVDPDLIDSFKDVL